MRRLNTTTLYNNLSNINTSILKNSIKHNLCHEIQLHKYICTHILFLLLPLLINIITRILYNDYIIILICTFVIFSDPKCHQPEKKIMKVNGVYTTGSLIHARNQQINNTETSIMIFRFFQKLKHRPCWISCQQVTYYSYLIFYWSDNFLIWKYVFENCAAIVVVPSSRQEIISVYIFEELTLMGLLYNSLNKSSLKCSNKMAYYSQFGYRCCTLLRI